jgi:ATP synthase protein I
MPLDKKNGNVVLKALGLFTQLGATMCTCVGIGVFIGSLLDKHLGTSPWLLLVFILFGVGAAIRVMFDLVKKAQ